MHNGLDRTGHGRRDHPKPARHETAAGTVPVRRGRAEYEGMQRSRLMEVAARSAVRGDTGRHTGRAAATARTAAADDRHRPAPEVVPSCSPRPPAGDMYLHANRPEAHPRAARCHKAMALASVENLSPHRHSCHRSARRPDRLSATAACLEPRRHRLFLGSIGCPV